jgi:acetyl esterase/lipase
MDGSPYAAIKFLIPRTPFLIKTLISHIFRISSTASEWNLRTELTVKLIRRLLADEPPTSILKQQKGTIKDSPVKGPMWISKVVIPPPTEDDLRQLLFTAIDELKEGEEQYAQAPPQPLEAEWTGHRANVGKNEPLPDVSEEEKYACLMKEVTSPTTILYLHGGAYYLLDPVIYRPLTSLLAKRVGGRVFSVRYRLAPQNPFPAALLDALHAYLSLLYPPPGSPHEPVPASHIVLSGDSAGGNLAAVLLQTLLHLHRRVPDGKLPTVTFNGKEVEIPLPAGCALNSPWMDHTGSMPSWELNNKYDFLPAPSHLNYRAPPADAIWPADPPRTTMYCEGSALRHRLVSPLLADFSGAPPVFLVSGQERLENDMLYTAQRLARQGVTVVADLFDAMPHCFALMLVDLPGSQLCIDRWTAFCKDAVERPESLKSAATRVAVKSLELSKMDLESLLDITDEQVEKNMRKNQKEMIEVRGKALPMQKAKL